MNEIDAYIATFPPERQERLRELRNLVRAHAPDAIEKISWGMPTFYQRGNLVHFAMHKDHLGFYPGEDAMVHFDSDMQAFKRSKGAVQFPLKQPLPTELVTKIVQFRVEVANNSPQKRGKSNT